MAFEKVGKDGAIEAVGSKGRPNGAGTGILIGAPPNGDGTVTAGELPTDPSIGPPTIGDRIELAAPGRLTETTGTSSCSESVSTVSFSPSPEYAKAVPIVQLPLCRNWTSLPTSMLFTSRGCGMCGVSLAMSAAAALAAASDTSKLGD